MHSLHGNAPGAKTQVNRATWESSLERQGVSLLNPDELDLPGDAALQVLRADQVSNGSQGISFVNAVWLPPKLKVKGGSYLLLILPGRLGSDLRSMLAEASPDMIGRTFETTLTLEDPIAKSEFVRNIVGVNLGLQDVKPATLEPTVSESS